MNKKGFEFSFAWLFALFVGVAIIFLAIYAASSFLKTGSEEHTSKVAAELGVLLNPIGTNLESSKRYSLTLPEETRIFNECVEEGTFGLQRLSVSTLSGLGEAWPKPGVPASFADKYVFSSDVVQGKELELFVKPLYIPYKVGDLIILYASPLCFVAPPNWVEDEISAAGARYVNITSNYSDCPRESISVCFAGGNCNVTVIMEDDRSGRVMKRGQPLFFYDSLLYGAIVSDKKQYDCQVMRLRKRAGEIARLYLGKTELLSAQGCSSGLEIDLRNYAEHLATSTSTLSSLIYESKLLGENNEKLSCKLF